MSTARKILLILLVGSIWGMLEVLVWDMWHLQGWSHASIPLAIVALFCLAGARRILGVTGSSLAIALVACLYKFASVAFFACQVTGVLTLAVTFEAVAWLTKRYLGEENQTRPYLLGLLTVYPAFFAFAFLSAFVILVPYWAEAGWARVLPYLGWSAVAATIGSTISAAMGWRLGKRLFSTEKIIRWRIAAPATAVVWGIAILHAWGL